MLLNGLELGVIESIYTALAGYNTAIGGAFATMHAGIATAVTDATFNVNAKIADCEKANFALYDAIWKQVNTDVAACLKAYATDDKYVMGNISILVKYLCSQAATPLNNVTMCIKSNALTDAKSINEANNCTVAALITCFENVSFVTLTYL